MNMENRQKKGKQRKEHSKIGKTKMEELTWEVVSGKHLASSGKYSVATWEV